MRNQEKKNAILPAHIIAAANEILQLGFQSEPLKQNLDAALKTIIALPEMAAHRSIAVYVRDASSEAMRLFAYRNVSLTKMEPVLVPGEADGDCFGMRPSRNGCVFALRNRADQRPCGVVAVFANGGKPVTAELESVLHYLGEAIATVIRAKQREVLSCQLSGIIDAAANEIYIVNPKDLNILKCNQAALRNSGYWPGDINLLTPHDLKEDMDEARYREHIEPVLTGEFTHVSFEARQRRKDGSTYDATVKVWKLQTDNTEALVELVVDHSDHNALVSLLSAAIDSFPGGFCAFDGNLRLSVANRRYYELLGLPEGQFPVGTRFEEIVRFFGERGDYGNGDVEKEVRKRVEYLKLSIEHSFDREIADGTIVEVRVAPLPAGGCVFTYNDVTDMRRAQMAVVRRRNDLEQAVRERTAEIERQSQELARALEHERRINELQRQFVAMTSHEFRTPLAIIDGSAQRLIRQRGEMTLDYIEDRAGRIRRAVSRMVELMDSILAAERLEDGKIGVELADCDLAEVIRACCERQAELARTHGVVCNLPDMRDPVRGDRLALEQVFTNLLSNAVKYSPPGSRIAVDGRHEGDMVCIAVSDQGVGIDADELPKMFQRFFRARTSSGIAGTGIGLNLVKQIVELHGGSIEVESRKGEGSTFTVRLPMAGENRRILDTPDSDQAAIVAA